MIFYIKLFFIFGLLGWIADTGYRSILAKKYAPGTLLPFFSPIYGFGAIILSLLFSQTAGTAPIVQIVTGWILILFLEFISGTLSLRILGRRLWDYTPAKFDLFGHIDLVHAGLWLLLISIFRLYFNNIHQFLQ